MSTINIGNISANVNTVTIGAAAQPIRTLDLAFNGGSITNGGLLGTANFTASKSANGGNNFEVTLNVNGPLSATTSVNVVGTQVQGFQVVDLSGGYQIVIQLSIPNSQPLANFQVQFNYAFPVVISAGSAQFTRVTGPFTAPPPINWQIIFAG